KLLDEVCQSVIYGFPTQRRKIELQKNEILKDFADLKEKVKRDRERITSLGKTDEKSIKAKLEKLQQQYEDLEKQTSERCNKYFERKREYTIELENIEGGVGRKVKAMRDAFVEKASDLTKGYEITFHGSISSPEELFKTFVEGHADIEDIHIKPLDREGFLDRITGTVSKHERAKESVLKYEAQAMAQKVPPFKKKEAELIANLDRKFNDLKGLEDDCKKVEEKRKEAVDTRDRLRMELEAVDAIEKLKDTYSGNLNEVTSKLEFLISLIEGIEGSKVEIEVVEKELDSLKKRNIESASKDELIECKKRVQELKSQIKHLETEIERRIDEMLEE
ncbi:MAG: hypothetical protein V3R93_08320, partial [Candidatus Hydrothermarchaeaceae archaeon]